MRAAPLFILSAPGTGAPWLAAMLGRHPEATGFPELNAFMARTLGDLQAIFGITRCNFEDGLLRARAWLDGGRADDDAIAQARRWLEQRADRLASDAVGELLSAAAPRTAVIAESNAGWRPDYLDRLAGSFPEARFLHLVAHPRLQCARLAGDLAGKLFVPPDYKDYSLSPPVVDPQLAWLRVNANIDRLLAQAPRTQVHRQRAEDLFADPETTLDRLCRWLGLPVSAGSAEAMLSPELSPFASHGPPAAPYGTEPEFLLEPRLVRRLRPHVSLGGPLPWRADGLGFAPEVIALARGYGYS